MRPGAFNTRVSSSALVIILVLGLSGTVRGDDSQGMSAAASSASRAWTILRLLTIESEFTQAWSRGVTIANLISRTTSSNTADSRSWTVDNESAPIRVFGEALSRSHTVMSHRLPTPLFAEAVSRAQTVILVAATPLRFDEALSRASTVWNHPDAPATLASSDPPNDGSLWRRENNTVRLEFSRSITPPSPGEVTIRPLLGCGVSGDDLSGGFDFTIESDDQGRARILRIQELGGILAHGQWYFFSNDGTWAGVAPFTLHYVLQIGDVTGDGQVLSSDVSAINGGIPDFEAPDNDRRDVNGDRRVLAADVRT
jgi:hypothetical protein